MKLSVVVPCRNEAAQIEATLRALSLASQAVPGGVEIIVVANGCTDGTAGLVRQYVPEARLVLSAAPNAPAARNEGARLSLGEVLVFVDADTRVEASALGSVLQHVSAGKHAGICALAPQSSGLRARAFFWFWNQVRRLPLPKAKAMPAFMFVTREAFLRHGPFDEDVLIGEEWPILSGVYKEARSALVYDRTQVARTSSRRMDLRPFGYLRVLGRYVWAVVHASGRIDYPDDVREEPT